MASVVHHPAIPSQRLPTSNAAPLVRLPWHLPRPAAFSTQRILFRAAMIVALLLVNKLGAAGSVVFFGILLVMILRSSEAAFIAFLIGMTGLVSNMAIVPKNLVWTPCRLLLPFVCLARFSFDLAASKRSLFNYSYYTALCLFVLIAAACSVISGYFTHIALLKLVSFSVGLTAVLAGTMVLQHRRSDLTEPFLSIAAVFVINGLLAMLLGNAYSRAVTGNLAGGSTFFAGPFYHPNACGPFCALFVTLLFAIWVYSPRRRLHICLLLAAPLVWYVLLSKSRTGLVSLVFGVLVVFVLTALAGGRGTLRLNLNRSRLSLVAWGFAIVLGLVVIDMASAGKIGSAIFSFAIKYNSTAETVGMKELFQSRQSLIATSWETFLDRPLTGIGFEVSLDPFFAQNATLFTAPIEKGFLPTAVLEEVGVLGTTAFVIFIVTFISTLASARNAVAFAMIITYLVTNLGEVTIFAFGGAGGLGWALVGTAMVIGQHCLVVRQPVRPAPLA